MYKWKPNKTQKRAFAIKMQDPAERRAYEARKSEKEENRRAASNFDYGTAGGEYIPTLAQSDFCMNHIEVFSTPKENLAAQEVIRGYSCQEKVAHDFIHIVDEKIRANG
jgi:hypothetical protein